MSAALAPASVLKAQAAVRRGNLERAREALASAAIDERLRQAVHVRFHTRLREIELLLDGVERCAGAPPLDGCWDALADAGRRSEELLGECLAFLEGALIRSAGIDRGVCDVADALLGELSSKTEVPWARLTILGHDDHVFSLADIVRLRFPEFTVWAVPVAAHEFGHVTARAHAALRSKLAAWKERDTRAEELFCDVLATYVLGPAYACTALLLRFSPLDRNTGSDHPPDAERARAILEVLGRLDAEAGDRPYALALDRLNATWPAGRTAAGTAPALDAGAEDRLLFLVDDMLANLELHVPLARYAGWAAARELAGRLGDDGARGDVRDVLNAAWHARLVSWGRKQPDVKALEQRALQLARAGTRGPAPAPAGAMS